MIRALVVDDNDEIRDLVVFLLKNFGLTAQSAPDGEKGLQAMTQGGPFDLVVVDLFMPRMDGFSFIEKVRANPAFKKARILVASNASLDAQVKKALDLGADEYLMKPFSQDMLREKLALLKVLPD